MQTTGFRTRLLKCIDILVAICSGKENKNLSPHNVSLQYIISAQKRAMVLPVSSIATVFINTTARLYPIYGHLLTHRRPNRKYFEIWWNILKFDGIFSEFHKTFRDFENNFGILEIISGIWK